MGWKIIKVKPLQPIMIGESIVKVHEVVSKGYVRLAINAPEEVLIEAKESPSLTGNKRQEINSEIERGLDHGKANWQESVVWNPSKQGSCGP